MEIAVDDNWLAAPEDLALAGDEVHVWRVPLDWPQDYVTHFRDLLTPDELSRAERYYHEEDRRRFLIARGMLRTILGRYLRLDPDQLRFTYGNRGKPALTSVFARETLSFNLSHALGLLLVAVTRNRRVGVDVEEIRLLPDLEQLAERFFAVPEKQALQALPPDERREAFFKLWTCKEAFAKARGDGLWLPLDRFHIAPVAGGSPPELHIPGDPGEAARWTLREIKPAPGYLATLAVEGVGWKLARWRCSRNQGFIKQPVS